MVNKVDKIIKECKICGEEFPVYPSMVDRYVTCSDKCSRELMSINKRGKCNHMWNEGNQGYWSPIIMERDGYECQWCHKVHIEGEYDINCCHIYNKEQFPEIKSWSGNMITLCVSCHNKWEGNAFIGLFEYLSMGGLI